VPITRQTITRPFRKFDNEVGTGGEIGMKEIILDGAGWKTKDDFYNTFFKAVGAPSWHGRNFNALRDSITTGQINEVELPYFIRVSGLDRMPADVKQLVDDFCALIKKFHSEGYEVDIACDG
jgi:RNAse (barnase) inhibitor barstar